VALKVIIYEQCTVLGYFATIIYMRKIYLLMLLLTIMLGFIGGSIKIASAADICYPAGGTGPPSPEACDSVGASEPIDPNASPTTSGSKAIDRVVNTLVGTVTAITGIVIVLSIIIGAIQYMTASDNSGQIAAAKKRIGMSILALFMFLFTFAILQWIVPGGVF
jgi:hypothetical protein